MLSRAAPENSTSAGSCAYLFDPNVFLQVSPPFLSNSFHSSVARSGAVAVCWPLLADYRLSSLENFLQAMAESVCCRVSAGKLWLSSWLITQTWLGGFFFAPASLH